MYVMQVCHTNFGIVITRQSYSLDNFNYVFFFIIDFNLCFNLLSLMIINFDN